jgi:hypothetical protein
MGLRKPIKHEQAAQDVLAEMWAAEEEPAAGAGRAQPSAVPRRAPRLRQLRATDVAAALQLVKPSTARADRYRNRLAPDAAPGAGVTSGAVDDGQQAAAAALAAAFGAAGFGAAGGGAVSPVGGGMVLLARLAALLESAQHAERPVGRPPAGGGGNGPGPSAS